MVWGNFRNSLLGGTKGRELDSTRSACAEVQALTRRAGLSEQLSLELADEFIRDGLRLVRGRPSRALVQAAWSVTEWLIDQERLGEIEPVWSVLDHDVEEAVRFREFLDHRRRWATNKGPLCEALRQEFLGFYGELFAVIENTGAADEEGAFEAPLIELVDRPAEFIERLLVFPFSDQAKRLGLFKPTRHQLVTNLYRASGLPIDPLIVQPTDRLVYPTGFRKPLSPMELAELYLGRTPLIELATTPIPLALPPDARFEHTHIVGGTGHGKTQLLQRMIHADLQAAQKDGRSVVVIDSQGDLINKLVRLDLFDPGNSDSLADRLVLIDPADVEFPASLNLFDANLARLADYRPVDRERVLNGVVELYEIFFSSLLGAELTQKQGVVFRYLARLMVSMEGATIHTLMQLMEDGRPFKPQMDQLEGSARYFFESEFFHPSFAATKKQILRRLWGVLSTPAFERMFTQPKNKLDLFEALKSGKIILVSTAKDLLKEEGSALFGRFFIAMLAQAALERSTLSEFERNPTFVYVDEAQEYFDDRIETILTQARKQKVAFHAAHQALDQISPRLRAAFASNTSLKCVGGVSAKDARALADELHTTADYIESMKRRGDRTEFAVWLKNYIPNAIRLTVPLGHLERQPTLTEEALEDLLDQNRERYCGTWADVPVFTRTTPPEEPERPPSASPTPPPQPGPAPEPRPEPSPVREVRQSPPPEPATAGKGGRTHRYLQSLVKELGEARGFRAIIEAPTQGGQIDVLLAAGEVRAAFEISVSTPTTWEKANLRKCLDGGFPHVGVILAKTARSQAAFRAALSDGLSAEELARVTFLAPEDLADYINSLAPASEPSESVVRGYRVKVSTKSLLPEEAKRRREQVARLIAQSM